VTTKVGSHKPLFFFIASYQWNDHVKRGIVFSLLKRQRK